MDYIVLFKQVPDIKNIPSEAWDWEKGTLKRSLLDNTCNELDKQAAAFALKMREITGDIIEYTPGLTESDLGVEIVYAEKSELTSNIAEAGAIVCGGAGCKTKDKFEKYVIPLTDSLGRFLLKQV